MSLAFSDKNTSDKETKRKRKQGRRKEGKLQMKIKWKDSKVSISKDIPIPGRGGP
jgi:hypothetical protein